MAIDPLAFREEGEFEAELGDMIDHFRGLTPSDPEPPVLVPGDTEDAAFANRMAHGIPMPEMLLKAMVDVCRDANVEFLLRENT